MPIPEKNDFFKKNKGVPSGKIYSWNKYTNTQKLRDL